MDENEKIEILEKIEKLVHSADKFNEMSFRVILEGMVNKGGEEAEFALVRYINSQDLELSARLDIIRVVGYLQSTHFLIPLKKIIDNEENIQLKKEAVISVAKFNNRQALNILNNALSHIKNPLLLQLINTEIGKIKRNNPIFALLPRFLEGEKDTKNFNITIDILKRILNPSDALMFTVYLNCGRPIIENGAFEILCFTAGIDAESSLWTFFQDCFNRIPCINQMMCDEFFFLTLKIKTYFLKNPTLIDQKLDDLGTQLLYIKDQRIRELYISIICRSNQASAIGFIKHIYDSVPLLQSTIIREYAGNEAAVDFLFEKYKTSGGDMKKDIIKSLLNSTKGIDYFYKQFPTLNQKEKELLLDCLPYGGTHDLSEFIKMALRSDPFELKRDLLLRIKESCEFSVKDILFDPGREAEFFFMEQEYLDTIFHLFPVTSIKKLLEKIAYTDIPTAKARKYLKKIAETAEGGFSFIYKDKEFLAHLFRRVTQLNNSELNALFLTFLTNFKTFDLETYRNIDQSLNAYTMQRESKPDVTEANTLRKIRKNMGDIFFEIRNIDEGYKTLTQNFAQKIPNVEQTVNLLIRYSLCVALLIEPLSVSIQNHLAESGTSDLSQWIKLFYHFPMLGLRVKETLMKKVGEEKGFITMDLTRLIQSLPLEPFKIVIRLYDKSIVAALRDQCKEIIPDVPLDMETNEWHDGDMLICDQETLKDFILDNALPSKKLFLLLDSRSDISSFKNYNPRPLVKPFSAYRIMKEILKDLYI
jgi:hypothetical protein